jgi:hypothetical protein
MSALEKPRGGRQRSERGVAPKKQAANVPLPSGAAAPAVR